MNDTITLEEHKKRIREILNRIEADNYSIDSETGLQVTESEAVSEVIAKIKAEEGIEE